jgi:hypothetical protein
MTGPRTTNDGDSRMEQMQTLSTTEKYGIMCRWVAEADRAQNRVFKDTVCEIALC